jgi:hypothetical protein
MRRVATVLIVAVGLVQAAPIVGAVASDFDAFYGVSVADDPNLLILLRSRAVYYGIVGIFLLYAVWRRQYLGPAMLLAGTGLGSYALHAVLEPDHNGKLGALIVIDLVAVACLVIAWILERSAAGTSPGPGATGSADLR